MPKHSTSRYPMGQGPMVVVYAGLDDRVPVLGICPGYSLELA